MWRCWSQPQWSWVLHISCSLAVTIQLVSLIQSHISPQSTNSENEEVNIQKMEFPLLFKICVQPSFNNSAAEELGYDGFWNYFSGMSRFNKSIFGWAGHTNSSGVKDTVPGVLSKVQYPETAKTLLTKIKVTWGPGNWTIFASDQIYLTQKRINYPHNCYTLDISNHTRGKLVQTISFFFKSSNGKKFKYLCKEEALKQAEMFMTTCYWLLVITSRPSLENGTSLF